MSAGITKGENGWMMAAALTTPVWHKLVSHTYELNSTSVKEVMQKIGAMYKVYAADIEAKVIDDAGNIVLLPTGNKKMLVRGPIDNLLNEYVVWEPISPRYEIIQNEQLAEVGEIINNAMPLSAAAVLHEGEIVFMTFKARNLTIMVNGKENPMELFLVIIHYADGSGPLKIILCPVEVVCNNTVMAAEASKFNTVKLNLGHRTGVTDLAKYVAKAFAKISKQAQTFQNFMQAIADVNGISDEDVKAIFEAAYPLPPRPSLLSLAEVIDDKDFDTSRLERASDTYRQALVLRDAYQDAFWNAYNSANIAGDKGNLWRAYASVTYVADHVSVGQRKASDVDRAESALFGERYKMKSRAWKAATEIAYLHGANLPKENDAAADDEPASDVA